jgi:hypothetical protein
MVTWRLPVAIAALLLCAGTLAYLTFPRPPGQGGGTTIRLPDHRPADPGTWHWPDGVPGWTPGQTIHDFPVCGVQPVEVQAAQLAAARHVLDGEQLRVLVSSRIDRRGVLAIVAAPTLYQTPVESCLAAILYDAPVTWLCPQDLGGSHVLVAAKHARVGYSDSLSLVGVARGDVARVVFAIEDGHFRPDRWPIYDRGKTWGEFQVNVTLRPHADPRLLVYGRRGLLQTLELPLQPNEQRVLR